MNEIKYQRELIPINLIKDKQKLDKQNYKARIFLSTGLSYSHFTSIDYYFRLSDFVGFHLAAEIQIDKSDRKFSNHYFVLGTDVYFCPTKVVYHKGEGYADIMSDVNRKLVNYNAKATYKSIIIFPTLGVPICEVSIGLGKVWYNIDKYVTGEVSQEFTQGSTAENQDLAIYHSGKIANLISETVWAYRLRFPIKEFYNDKIRIWFALQGMVGMNYWSSKYGWYVNWGEPDTKNRMTALCVSFQIKYQIN